MNATKPGLYNAVDAMDDEDGTPEAKADAARLIRQAAGLSLLCSLALDSAVLEDCELDYTAEYLEKTASSVLFKCFDDLTVAVNIMDA